MIKWNLTRVLHSAGGRVLLFVLSLCSLLFSFSPVSATSTVYNLGNYTLYNQSSGTPTTSYRLGSGSYDSYTESVTSYSESLWGYSTTSQLVIRMRMRGSNNTMPALVNPSLIEYTVVTNNLTWRGSANVSSDFLPLGCELSGTVGAWSSWSCIGFNTDSASGGSDHFIQAGNWWSIAASSGNQSSPYFGQIQVVDWRQYVPDDDTIDYTSLLQDIRNNTANTATLSEQIRNQLQNANNSLTDISQRSTEIRNQLITLNQSVVAQGQATQQSIVAQGQATQQSINNQTQQQEEQYEQEKEEESEREEQGNADSQQAQGLFNFSVFNPFGAIFGLFSDGCVSLPTVGGMLNKPDATMCPWFPSSIRSVLTPVFGLASSMLLFGFVVRWLSGNSGDIYGARNFGKELD